MKKITVLIFIFSSLLLSVNAQEEDIVVFKTQNFNVGFGKVSNCSTNIYMNFCVNGPLVGIDNYPIGGYIDNYHTMKDWVNPENHGGNFEVDNSIFGLSKDGFFCMFPYYERDNLPLMKWAFQNGPILVKDGKNVRGTSETKFKRSGIGYRTDGTLIVIISLKPITFFEFANFFIKENCLNAIYLDGGPYVGYSNNQTSTGMIEGAVKLQFYN